MRTKVVRPPILLLILSVFLPVFGQTGRYAIILQDPPLAAAASSGKQLRAMASTPAASRIATAQATVRDVARARGAEFLHSTQTLLNAVYVKATREQAAAIRSTPGVLAVVEVPTFKRHMTAALQLINASGGWNAVGGQANAGAGSKIAILDTGIDISHPAFNDAGFTKPAGFPICDAAVSGCAFTNNKVIVARSYVQKLAAGNGTPPDSRPDDLSPRDHIGHGTALAMIAAGVPHASPQGQISGVAPKAYLGNYKIFGSPGVNDVFTISVMGDVLVAALEDAVKDQMDIAVVALGRAALWSPADVGATCQFTGTQPCDPWAAAVQNATNVGLTVVTSAGNDGDLGYNGFYPNLNSINTPGTAPGAITVGATTNSHDIYQSINATGSGVLPLKFTDGPRPAAPLTAPLRDASALNGNVQGCNPFAANALAGTVALIQYGGANDCSAYTKIQNAQNAGAVAVLLYRATSNNVFPLTGVTDTGIPAAIVGANTGAALKQSSLEKPVTLNPVFDQVVATTPDEIAYFSSQGPGVGTFAIKPEVVAPGTGLYVATQTYDPNGDMWNPTGYTVVQGTSFASAMVAGAAAIAKQRFPDLRLSPSLLKSMIVNTANPAGVVDFDANNNRIPARVTAQGAGKLDVGAAAQTTIAAEPATISFGVVNPLPASGVSLRITNLGTAPATLQFAVQQRDADARASVRLSRGSATLASGDSTTITVSLTGAVPAAGAYEGAIVVTGGAVPIRIPYLYLVGSGIVDNVYSMRNFDYAETTSAQIELDFKAVDAYGVPVPGVSYTATPGCGTTVTQGCVSQADTATDALGVGYAVVNAGPQVGEQSIRFNINGLTNPLYFYGRVYAPPAIQSVIDAGSLQTAKVAPGSYIAIKGAGLSPTTRVFSDLGGRSYLPLSLSDVSVSFDTTDGRLSLPGRIHFVSPGQVNVQVPWEFQGRSSVLMKVSIGAAQSAYDVASMYTVQLADYAPNFFEYDEAGTGLKLVAARDENYQLLGSNNPAKRGHYVQLYANGLGPVDLAIPSGQAAPTNPLVNTTTKPTVSIGGTPVPAGNIQFSGLTPGVVSLYQINVLVPENAPTGPQSLSVSIGGATSKESKIVIQ